MAKTITRELLRALRDDIDEALKAVAVKHGIELDTGNATFSDTTFTMKLAGKIQGALSQEAELYEINRPLFKLPPLNTVVTMKGTDYAVVGMTSRGRKVLLERKNDGKGFTTSVENLLRLIPGGKELSEAAAEKAFEAKSS